jgi:outer membrane protein assembly factor BamB
VYSGPPLAASWPAGGPRVAWRKSVGQGFAGPVVADGHVILFHRIGREEIVEALDARTGETRWRTPNPTAYQDDFGFDEGPRSVPVVASGRIFTFGAEGYLQALEAATGRRIWNVDTMRRFGVRKGFFGAAGSPLVEEGHVIANIGGRDGAKGAGVVAFSTETGSVVWTATDNEASYSSPVAGTIGGRRQVIFLTRAGLVGLDPSSGSVLFQKPWRSRMAASVNAATPLVIDDIVFVSASYGTGAAAFRVKGSELVQLWASDDVLSNHYATSVYSNGYLYGYHGRQEFGQSLRAAALATGKVAWSIDGFGAGSITLAGDRLLIVRENGELVLAPATPQAFRPVARAQVMKGVVRAFPALADGFLYLRSEDALVCLDLRAQQ